MFGKALSVRVLPAPDHARDIPRVDRGIQPRTGRPTTRFHESLRMGHLYPPDSRPPGCSQLTASGRILRCRSPYFQGSERTPNGNNRTICTRPGGWRQPPTPLRPGPGHVPPCPNGVTRPRIPGSVSRPVCRSGCGNPKPSDRSSAGTPCGNCPHRKTPAQRQYRRWSFPGPRHSASPVPDESG